MQVKINPKKLSGIVSPPPSKSLSHRAIIAASLAKGTSKISNVLFSNDILRTMEAMEALGATYDVFEDSLIVHGCTPKRVKNIMNAGESGSTIRFMIPIMMTIDEPMVFAGENNLVNRPLDVFTDLFDEFQIKYEKGNNALPLKVYNGLKPGIYNIRGDISSQFITGLLYALCLLSGDSTINITTNVESIGYIDLTLDILKMYGIQITHQDYKTFFIKGKQIFSPCDYTIESDYSQAAFFLVAGALGSEVTLKNMRFDSYQGDKAIIDILKDMKAEVVVEDDMITVKPSKTYGTTIDLSQCPDLGPIVTVLACLSEGVTRIVNASRLRIKECDRITAIRLELEKLGAKIIEYEDGMIIYGIHEFSASKLLESHNDHRIAMALTIASTRCNDVCVINEAESVKKSYPTFYETIKKLNGDIAELNQLEYARYKIEEIDKEMVELFERRMDCSREVGIYKRQHNLPVFDQMREKSLIKKNINLLIDKELEEYYLTFFEGLLAASKDFQKDEK